MMSVKRDWKTYLLFVFSLCPFTSSFYMNPNDHITGTTNHNKYVEKYQLLGGKSLVLLFLEIVWGETSLSAMRNLVEIIFSE